MIKEVNFPNFFSDSSQIMPKLGRNVPSKSCEIKKKLMTSSLIHKYYVIIVILMSRQLKKWKVFIFSLFLDGLS